MGLLRRDPDRPGALERGRMRRRLRRQTQVREALLLDLGALVFELHRQGRREPELLQAKAAELMAVDEEVRALDDALGTGSGVLQLTAAGIAGTCSQCSAIMPIDARYCASCGASAQVALGPGTGDDAPAVHAAEETPPLPPREEEPPEEIPTEERAALEAGDFEQEEPGPAIGEEWEYEQEEAEYEEAEYEQAAPEAQEYEEAEPGAEYEQAEYDQGEQETFVQDEQDTFVEEPPPVPEAPDNGAEEPGGESRRPLWRRREG